ncbi:MAG: CHAD domain-containing protein [Acidobacteriaceae bacterium]
MKAERFAAVASRLECTLGRCVEAPDAEAIHHVRTGSRRLDAALDALERETCETAAMRKSAAKLRKLLKRMRGRAGRVRDLDVHRGLLQKMSQQVDAEGVSEELAGLDAALAGRRERRAAKFGQRAGRWREKLELRTGKLLAATREAGDPPAVAETADLALKSFAALCREMPVLDAGNLHAFRKGAKHARYIAEGGEDAWSQRTAKGLKRVQDAIGMWHDWLVLAEEARDAAGGQQTELVKRIEARRERQFGSAMRTAERVKRELLGEWESFSEKREGRGEAADRAEWRKTA